MFFNNFFLIKTKMLNKFKIKNNIVRNFYVGFIYRPFNFKGRKSCYRVSVKNGKLNLATDHNIILLQKL